MHIWDTDGDGTIDRVSNVANPRQRALAQKLVTDFRTRLPQELKAFKKRLENAAHPEPTTSYVCGLGSFHNPKENSAIKRSANGESVYSWDGNESADSAHFRAGSVDVAITAMGALDDPSGRERLMPTFRMTVPGLGEEPDQCHKIDPLREGVEVYLKLLDLLVREK